MFTLVLIVIFIYLVYFSLHKTKEHKEESKAIKETDINQDIKTIKETHIKQDLILDLQKFISIINCRKYFTEISVKYREIITNITLMRKLVDSEDYYEAKKYGDKLLEEYRKFSQDNETKINSFIVNELDWTIDDIEKNTESILLNSINLCDKYEKIIDNNYKELSIVYNVDLLKETYRRINQEFNNEVQILTDIFKKISDSGYSGCSFVFWCSFLNLTNYLSTVLSLLRCSPGLAYITKSKQDSFLIEIENISKEITFNLNLNIRKDLPASIELISADKVFIEKIFSRISDNLDRLFCQNDLIKINKSKKSTYIRSNKFPILKPGITCKSRLFDGIDTSILDGELNKLLIDTETKEQFFREIGARKVKFDPNTVRQKRILTQKSTQNEK